MAERPIFIPRKRGPRLVDELVVQMTWHSGFAPIQKKKNVASLHHSAELMGIGPLLEISSKSEREAGRRLSAFNLQTVVEDRQTSIECAFQSSKVFENGGPYRDLLWVDSREAKRDSRLKESGRLIAFDFNSRHYPLSPPTMFYDWLYCNALFPHRDWLTRLRQCAGFTDIEFNPGRSINCQARSCAAFVAMDIQGVLDEALLSFESFEALYRKGEI
jgi:hypothetical protein